MLSIESNRNIDNMNWTITTTDAMVLVLLKNGIEGRMALCQRLANNSRTDEKTRVEMQEEIKVYKEYLKQL